MPDGRQSQVSVLSMRGSGMHTVMLFDYDVAWISINPAVGSPPTELRKPACRRVALRRGHIGGEVRIFVQHPRGFQPEQHRHHHQVARAEPPSSQLASPRRRESWPSRLRTRSSTRGMRCADQVCHPLRSWRFQVQGWAAHRAQRCEHPCDCARPGIRIARQQARMALRDMEHHRPGLEQGQIASS